MDSYTKGYQKLIDFIAGFLMVIICVIISSLLTMNNTQIGLSYLILLCMSVPLIILFILYRKKRKYISIGISVGILLFVLIPFLLFGACILMFAGSYNT